MICPHCRKHFKDQREINKACETLNELFEPLTEEEQTLTIEYILAFNPSLTKRLEKVVELWESRKNDQSENASGI